MKEIPENSHPLNRLARKQMIALGIVPDPARPYLLQLAKWGLEQGLSQHPQMTRLRRPLITLAENLSAANHGPVMREIAAVSLPAEELRGLTPEQASEEAIDALVSLAAKLGWTPEGEAVGIEA